MPAFITNTVHIQRYADAVYGVQVGSVTLAQVNQDITSLGGIDKALNAYFAGSGQTNATVAANIVKNVGIVAGGTITAAAVTDATAYVLGQLNANKGNEGATIKNILNLVGNLTADPVYGAAAVKFNADVDRAIAYTGALDLAAGTVTPVTSVSFTLTTTSDMWSGTSGDDIVSAYDTYTNAAAKTVPETNSTFTSADTLAFGLGVDTLNLVIDGAIDGGGNVGGDNVALQAPSVTGLEILNIRSVATATAAADIIAVNADNFAGLTNFNADRSTAGLVVTNLATGAGIGISGNGAVSNGALTASYKTSTAAVTLNVSGGTVNTSNAATFAIGTGTATTATINSTGGTNALDTVALASTGSVTALTINATTKLTTGTISGFKGSVTTNTIAANGAGDLSIGTIDSTVGTFDASTMTGGVTATSGAVGTTFKGGSGKDVITAFAGAMTGTLDGGAGTTDTINFTASTDYAANASKISNFEILRVTAGGTSTFNFAAITGLTGLELASSANTTTVTNLPAANAVTVIGNNKSNGKAVTLALTDASGTTDTLNLSLKSSTAATAVELGLDGTGDGLVTAGIETLNVTSSNALASGTNNILFIEGTTSGLKTITGTGDSGLTLNTSAYAAITTINTSASTGATALTLAAPTTTTTITTGGAADSLTMALGDLSNTVSWDAGLGTDTLTLTSTGTKTLADSIFTNLKNVDKVGLTVTSTPIVNFAAGGFFQTAFGGAGGKVTFDLTISGVGTASGLDFSGVANNVTSTIATGTTGNALITAKGGFGNDNLKITATGTTGQFAFFGGAGDDVLTFEGTDDTAMTGGAGADTYVHSSSATGIDNIIIAALTDSTVSSMDVITSYVSTSDTIDLSAAALVSAYDVAANVTASTGATNGIATGLFTFNKAAATSLTDAITKVGADVKTAGKAVVFNYGGDAYFFADTDGASTTSADIIIKLTGLTAASMAASTEVFTVS